MRLRLEHVAFFLAVFAFTCCDATPSDPTDHPGACTTLIATKGATADGSVMVTHSMDEANNDFRLVHVPAKDYADPSSNPRPVYLDHEIYPRLVSADVSPSYAPVDPDPSDPNQTFPVSEPIGHIPQVNHTFAFLDLSYGALNEHQLAIGETTCSAKTVGLPVSKGGKALFWVGELSHVAMERCITARCAVELMGALAERYGFYGGDEVEGGGETLTVADRHEAWVFHVLAGPAGEGGAIWVARRVPDGHVTVLANMFSIRAVNLTDTANFLGRRDMVAVAQQQGWYEPARDGAFDFTAAFSNGEYAHEYYSGRRMWRALSMWAPSLHLDPIVGSPLNRSGLPAGETFYPWSLKPEAKVEVSTLQRIHRDSYQGTQFDMTVGLAAGAFGSPNRWAETYKSPAGKGAWERAISIYRVNYCHITQLRSWLPDEVGGVMWFGPHAPHTTVFVPIYSGARSVPTPYATGSMAHYDRNVAWWAHSFVSNFAELKWSYMIQDIQKRQAALEGRFFAAQAALEERAVAALARKDVADARAILAGHSNDAAASTLETWHALTDYLITKYNNGYINTPGDINNVGQEVGYPTWWLKAVGYEQFPSLSPTVCEPAPTTESLSQEKQQGQLEVLRAQLRRLGVTPEV